MILQHLVEDNHKILISPNQLGRWVVATMGLKGGQKEKIVNDR